MSEESFKVKELKAEVALLQEALFDVFNQACQVSFNHCTGKAKYDHQFLSAYEDAQQILIDRKVITEDECKCK